MTRGDRARASVPDSFSELVADAGGVKTFAMEDLLPLVGSRYLSKYAPRRISEAIYALGLRHVPRELPQDRWAYVRVFDPSSTSGQLVRAVLEPDEVSDDLIRRLSGE